MRRSGQPSKPLLVGRNRSFKIAAVVICLVAYDGNASRLTADSIETLPASQTHVEITVETFEPTAFPLEAFGD